MSIKFKSFWLGVLARSHSAELNNATLGKLALYMSGLTRR